MLQKPYQGFYSLGQKFGENFNSHYKEEGLLGHSGIDIPMPNGTPIFSAVNGTVIAVTRDIQKGEGVAVMSSDIFQYKGQDCVFDTIYWHFKDGSILVNIGDKVVAGQQIGLSNNTGQTTGPHLHFSISPMATDDSRALLEPRNNGYNGCIDPLPYVGHWFTPDTTKIKELQTLLNKYGAKLVVDGKFGKLSTQALADFLK